MNTHRGFVRPQLSAFCFGALLASMPGCTSSPMPDAGTDTGTIVDNGVADMGMAVDVTDVQHTHPQDDGVTADVPAVDGSDVGVATDVVVGDVAVGDAGEPTIHNCTTFEDRTSAASDHNIAFMNFRYTPNCVTIAAGQAITFNGEFAVHQFRGGVAPSRIALDPPGSPGNPMTAVDSGTTATFVFPSAGTFPFFCLDHEGTGMFGVVRVR